MLLENSITELKRTGRGIKDLRSFKFKHLAPIFKMFGKKEKIWVISLLALIIIDVLLLSIGFYSTNTVVVPANGGSYSEGMVGEPRFINPLLAQTQTDKDLTRLVFAGLYKYDNQGNIVPDLAAENFKLSDDQKQYTVSLKPNLKWQDGHTISSDDVIFTIQTIQNPDYKSPMHSLWSSIVAEKIDNLTIKFTNKNVSAPFVTNLTLGILPKHIWQNVPPQNFYIAKYNLEPVGNGPYFVKEINKLPNGTVRSILLESYSNYANGKAYIDEISLKFYLTNQDMISGLHTKEVDSIGFIPFDKKIFVDPKNTKLNILQIPVFQYQALFFNLSKNKALGSHAVREAMAKSINRESFISDVYSGMALPAYTPILPEQIGYDQNVTLKNSFDLEAANAILEKDGWKKDSSGMRFKGKDALQFTITTNDFSLNVKSAEALKEQWAKIGFSININVVASAEFEKNYLRTRNFEGLLFAESSGYDPDPFIFWHSSQSNNPGVNLSQYKNLTIDKIITDARTTFNGSARDTLYKQFQDIFSYDLPAIILDQSVFVYEMRPDVKGINIKVLANPEDRFYDVNHWYLETGRDLK
ncbi:MAG: Uncharacterized protein G01um101477_104 [Candidatus Doudnabacteria bacterium Gr01-1014_77]|uniref:Solute-binding protein family 5 domain-containing protein n=1 Tax=Candidatus Doudnabacteria bacterium Gr01-1014_77 TaxID=2017133 RepID=A0A554JDD5_9BACT|nr:MAG: Uncharacterized protein G01um101477_104 [Candidatus Doudnabacteria bacterium Gr01-1014_77]